MFINAIICMANSTTESIFPWIALSTIYVLISLIVTIFLSVSIYDEFQQIIVKLSKPPEINITRNDIKKLDVACSKLDKYGISYKIDFVDMKIDTEISMSLYTRMSIANNLDPNVHYHISGTDVILHNGARE